MSLQRITVWADGGTEPVVASGTPIILIQGGAAEVGKLVLEEDDYGNISIEHPTNSTELNGEAFSVVSQEPDLLASQKSVIVLCPQNIVVKMRWQD